jgi:membrane protein implicated in regulation of membrane protease activity
MALTVILLGLASMVSGLAWPRSEAAPGRILVDGILFLSLVCALVILVRRLLTRR